MISYGFGYPMEKEKCEFRDLLLETSWYEFKFGTIIFIMISVIIEMLCLKFHVTSA